MQGAVDPAFELGGSHVDGRHVHVRRDVRAELGKVLVLVAQVGEAPELPRPVGADGGAGGDDTLAELHQREPAVGRPGLEADAPDPVMVQMLGGDQDGDLVRADAGQPRWTPPMKLSSTSTSPESISRSGRTIARRSLCIHAHAVS
jgi:hypothetical protein